MRGLGEEEAEQEAQREVIERLQEAANHRRSSMAKIGTARSPVALAAACGGAFNSQRNSALCGEFARWNSIGAPLRL